MAEENQNHDIPIANRCGKTRIHFNEFIYTWTLENYIQFKNDTENVTIASPTIVVYNDNDRYEFQQLVTTRNAVGSYYSFYLNLKVLSCPDIQKKVYLRYNFATKKHAEYNVVESYPIIKKDAIIATYKIDHGNLFAYGLSNGNLTVKCKFTFRNGHSNIEPETPDLEAARALSKMSILDEYEMLLNSAKFTDVTLVVGEKKFPAHKAVLASRSPVFSAMFEHKMLENKENIVEITDVEPEIMVEVLCFIYASKVKSLKKATADLLAAADKYQLETLRVMCEEVFIEKLNIDNLEEILKIVDRYETCQRLRNAVLKFLSFNGKEVANWENFDRVMKTLSPSFLFEATKATMLKS